MTRGLAFPLFLLLAACNRCGAPVAGDAGASIEWLEGTPLPETGTPRKGGSLTVRAMAEPGGLDFLEDPFHDAWVARMTRNTVTEALLEIDPVTYALKPQLAASFDGGVFHLREGVKFHDGSAFTAADVIATLDRVMDVKQRTGATRGDFVDLESYRALDEHTVELKWKTESAFHLRAVAKLPICRCSDARHPIGTGPYAFESWQGGDRLTLKRRDDRAFVDTLVFRFAKDHTLAGSLFERGEFDLMTLIQPVLWRAMEAAPWARTGYRRLKSIDNSYSYIAWNEARPYFADARTRRALARLYPRDVIARSVDLGLEVPTTCPYWLKSKSCDPSVEPIPYSPETARASLADAGFTFTFLIPATSVRLGKVAPLLQEEMRRAGITMQIETVDTATLAQRVTRRDFDATSRVWTELDAAQDQYGTFHSSQIDGGSNFAGYASAEADRLLEQIRVEPDETKRVELERALHRRLYQDQPYLFMTARQSLDAAKITVHGLQPSLLWYDLRKVWVEPAP